MSVCHLGLNGENQKGREVRQLSTKLIFGLDGGEKRLRAQRQHISETDGDRKRGRQVKRKMATGKVVDLSVEVIKLLPNVRLVERHTTAPQYSKVIYTID